MYTCSHCKKKFMNEPYICYPNKKKYCSLECIPDSAIDKPYSFEYFTLIESIRDIQSRIDSIATLDNRIDLEDDVNELYRTYALEIYGDDEGLFYKKHIAIMLSTLDKLYDKIHNIFMERKYESSPAVIIYWEDLINILGKDTARQFFDIFKGEIENFIFENVYFIWSDYKCKTIDFNNYEDKLKFATINDAEEVQQLFLGCLNLFRPEFTEKQLEELDNYSQCITVDTLYNCVACGEWELWERFHFYDNLKLYKCDEHCACDEYDHLYLDE
jgi:hypothetical protein